MARRKLAVLRIGDEVTCSGCKQSFGKIGKDGRWPEIIGCPHNLDGDECALMKVTVARNPIEHRGPRSRRSQPGRPELESGM